jgi:hypothetical protein
MAAHVGAEIRSDAPLHEKTPLPVAALEAVVVAPLTMGCKARSGSACSAMKYDRDIAVPPSSSTSMARLVATCLVRGVRRHKGDRKPQSVQSTAARATRAVAEIERVDVEVGRHARRPRGLRHECTPRR